MANYVVLRQAAGWLGTLLPGILLIADPIALRSEHSSRTWLPPRSAVTTIRWSAIAGTLDEGA